jgi:hypothetical protein
MQRAKKIFIFYCLIILSFNINAQDYGGVGYIDMPSAYMLGDADIKISHSRDFFHEGTALTYQITPFLMGTFRYSGFHTSWIWDRNIEVKARLLKESSYLPEVSLGIRDIGGTAIFGGEYLVASKTLDNLSLSLGMGWGRLSGDGQFTNPLTFISDQYSTRGGSIGLGGTVRGSDFFSGESVGFFGGLSYQLSNLPIELQVEYSSDNFSGDQSTNTEYATQINYGVKWNRNDNTAFTLSRQHGDWGLTADFVANTRDTPRAYKTNLSNLSSLLPGSISNNLFELLNYDAYRRGLNIIDGEIDEDEIVLVISASRINFIEDLVTEAMDLLSIHLPENINHARIILLDEGFQLYEIDVDLHEYRLERSMGAATLSGLDVYSSPFWGTRGISDFNLDWSLKFKQQIFDPDNPLRPWLTFGPNITFRLPRELVLLGRYEWSIYDEFDDNRRDANSRLPHVRTELMRYLTEGKSGLDYLYINKRGNLDSAWKYDISFGYLEWMYAGLNIDLLNYNPFSDFAYGISFAKLRQRAFDRGLGFNELDATTFFISGYWDSPFYDMDFAIHAGQYLAGDKGATIDIRRSFESGWEVGAFATFTDVSFEDFGEGSFDKGFYFSVPWSNYINQNISRRGRNKIRFIQRDGGQYLDGFVGQFWFSMQHTDPSYLQ